MSKVQIIPLAALLAGALVAQFPAQAKPKTPIAHEVAPANPVPWSLAEGKDKVDAGAEDGVYIWHKGDEVHIVTTSTSKTGVLFGGIIEVDKGAITDVKSSSNEKKDLWKQVSPTQISFAFETHKGKDGLHFRVPGATKIGILAKEKSAKVSDAPIFIGPGEKVATKLPLIFDLKK